MSHYAGASLWIPGAATVLLLVLFTRTPLRPKYFLGAITITGGHLVWFAVAAMIGNMWAAAALDLVVPLAGILWLWLRPGLASALFLGLVQLVGLVFNAYQLGSNPVGSLPHKALTVHCIWRLLALIGIVIGYLKLRRDQMAAASPAFHEAAGVEPTDA